jgi:hypothetical protein
LDGIEVDQVISSIMDFSGIWVVGEVFILEGNITKQEGK